MVTIVLSGFISHEPIEQAIWEVDIHGLQRYIIVIVVNIAICAGIMILSPSHEDPIRMGIALRTISV